MLAGFPATMCTPPILRPGQLHPRDRRAALRWSRPDAQARADLRQTLHRFERTLPGADQPPKSFLRDSRKPPTRGPCESLPACSNSLRSSRWRDVSLVGISTITW